MKVTGIIAEYNPFHLGHKYHIEETRRLTDCDYVISVISGDYVQRGAPAVMEKHLRARAALQSGADLCLELPVSYACSSAEFFAGGAVCLLSKLNVVDYLSFGSEHGNLHALKKTASLLAQESPLYQNRLKEELKTGVPFPKARANALLSCLTLSEQKEICQDLESFLSLPNNILGIEYCKAILKEGSSIVPVTVTRQGCGYHDSTIEAPFASASAVRSHLRSQGALEELEEQLPQESYRLTGQAFKQNRLMDSDDFSLLIACRLLDEDLSSLCSFLDFPESLARRVLNNREQFSSFSDFVSLLKTREITQTAIQRALFHMILNLRERPPVSYARVLGMRLGAAPLLKAIKQKGEIPLLTRPASYSGNASGRTLLEQEVYASNLYQRILSLKGHTPFIHEYAKPLVVIP